MRERAPIIQTINVTDARQNRSQLLDKVFHSKTGVIANVWRTTSDEVSLSQSEPNPARSFADAWDNATELG